MMYNEELCTNIYGYMIDCGRSMHIIKHTITDKKQCIATLGETIDNAQHENSCEHLQWAEQVEHVKQMEVRLQRLSETFQLLRDTHVRLQMQHDIIEADMRTSTEDLIRLTVCSRDVDGRTHGG